jgi:hypothetical protein
VVLGLEEPGTRLFPLIAECGGVHLPAKLQHLGFPIGAGIRCRCSHSGARCRILGMGWDDRRRENQSGGEKNNSHNEASLFSSPNG